MCASIVNVVASADEKTFPVFGTLTCNAFIEGFNLKLWRFFVGRVLNCTVGHMREELYFKVSFSPWCGYLRPRKCLDDSSQSE